MPIALQAVLSCLILVKCLQVGDKKCDYEKDFLKLDRSYDKGIIVCEDFDKELIDLAYSPYDNISLLVTLKSNGSIDKQVIGSVVESTTEYERYKELFRKKSLQIVSFTITEKGYAIKNASGEILPVVQSDMEEKSDIPKHLMSKITALCYERYLCGKSPLALVSMDNCSNNGDKLKASIIFIAEEWVKRGYCEQEFIEYLNDSNKIAFPCSMIDKITPRPDALVKEMLEKDGFVDTGVIITSKNTYTAPFVNAEETEYLVIEDKFPNGRPALEQAGFYMTDRKTVDDCERMKVCTCLNPLHTCLAIFGCLLGYEKISEEMKDVQLRKLVETVGYVEGLPVVVNPGVLDPKEFIDTVLNVRIPNPFMPDTPQRIATDTSQKLAIRFGETIKNYQVVEDILKAFFNEYKKTPGLIDVRLERGILASFDYYRVIANWLFFNEIIKNDSEYKRALKASGNKPSYEVNYNLNILKRLIGGFNFNRQRYTGDKLDIKAMFEHTMSAFKALDGTLFKDYEAANNKQLTNDERAAMAQEVMGKAHGACVTAIRTYEPIWRETYAEVVKYMQENPLQPAANTEANA